MKMVAPSDIEELCLSWQESLLDAATIIAEGN